MKLLSKEDIFGIDDRKSEIVDVPEWGGQVKIKTMSGSEKDAFEAQCIGPNGGTNMKHIRAKLIAACVVDEEGKQMFTRDDIVKLGSKSAAALDRIFTAIQKLNAVSDEDVEEMAGN
jgi:hypothetical protein